jgi:oligopeptide/dipeptide ABC transporter ATP-binding protein
MSTETGPPPLLDVRGLQKFFPITRGFLQRTVGHVRAVDGVDFTVNEGETLGLVGESGCGKTTVALAMLNLLPTAGRIVSGQILLDDGDILALQGDDLRKIRGRAISMIFQDPVSGLNPVMSIGAQVEEIVRTHLAVPKRESRRMAADALREQGLQPERLMDAYPFQLSGGMCQRVMIAIATILRPRVIIADEPTSALDVTVQAQILRELDELKRTLNASILLITHDLGVVAQLCDRVGVMYAGQLVEVAPVAEIFRAPRHPYTQALLAALPTTGQARGALRVIEGRVPDLIDPPPGCRFAPRCPYRMPECDRVPLLAAESSDHRIACWLSNATRAAGGEGPLMPANSSAGGASA